MLFIEYEVHPDGEIELVQINRFVRAIGLGPRRR